MVKDAEPERREEGGGEGREARYRKEKLINDFILG